MKSNVVSSKIINIFISYAHEDKKYLLLLMSHLGPLVKNNKNNIDCWHDEYLQIGESWRNDLSKRLIQSNVFIVLVTINSFNSKFIQEKEQKFALKKHSNGEMIFIPILVQSLDWKETIYGDYQMITENGEPITTIKNQQKAWTNVVKKIKAKLKDEFPSVWDEGKNDNAIVEVASSKNSLKTRNSISNLTDKSTVNKLKKETTLFSNSNLIDDLLIRELETFYFIMKKNNDINGDSKLLTYYEIEKVLINFRKIEKQIKPLIVGLNVIQILPDVLLDISEYMGSFNQTIKKCNNNNTSEYLVYAGKIHDNCTSLRKEMIRSVTGMGIQDDALPAIEASISELHTNILYLILSLEDLLERAARFSTN